MVQAARKGLWGILCHRNILRNSILDIKLNIILSISHFTFLESREACFLRLRIASCNHTSFSTPLWNVHLFMIISHSMLVVRRMKIGMKILWGFDGLALNTLWACYPNSATYETLQSYCGFCLKYLLHWNIMLRLLYSDQIVVVKENCPQIYL